MHDPVRMPVACNEAMVRHALQETPNECCGVLIGRNGRIERAVPMRNVRPSPDAYFMDPDEQIALFTAMEQRGEQLLGIYHSHPRGPATPSPADRQLAFHPDALYVVVSLADPDRPDVRGFAVSADGFTDVPIAFF